MAVRRSPSSRATAASNAALSSNPTSCMAAPRHKASASRSRRTSSSSRAWPMRRSNRTASTASGSTAIGSRFRRPRPTLPASPSAAGKPSVARHSPRRQAGAHPRPNRSSVALRDHVTWFEREGDQQPAQPGARHVDQRARIGANLERSKHPDLHGADSAIGDRQARVATIHRTISSAIALAPSIRGACPDIVNDGDHRGSSRVPGSAGARRPSRRCARCGRLDREPRRRHLRLDCAARMSVARWSGETPSTRTTQPSLFSVRSGAISL